MSGTLRCRLRERATGVFNVSVLSPQARSSPGSIDTAYPGRRNPSLFPNQSVTGTPSHRPARLSANPRFGKTGYAAPMRTRYWSGTDITASDGRLRPVSTPLVFRGLIREVAAAEKVVFPIRL